MIFFFSDNALSFKTADKELQQFEKIIKDQELQDFISNKFCDMEIYH